MKLITWSRRVRRLRGFPLILAVVLVAIAGLTVVFTSGATGGTLPNTLDGDRCPGHSPEQSSDEWGWPADDSDDSLTNTASADILNVWAAWSSPDLYIAFNRESSGHSLYAFYFDTD